MSLTPEQLYQKQQKYGQYAQVAGGALSLAGQWGMDQHKNDLINTNIPGQETDYTGKPLYSLGSVQQNINQIDTSGPSAGGIATGALQGAAAGAAFGGIGAAIGGFIGGVGSAISGIVGGNAARRKKRLAQQNLLSAQRMYNAQMAQYNTQQAGQQSYQDLLNNNREFNIYKYNSPYTV